MAVQQTRHPTITSLDDLCERQDLPDRYEVIRGEIVEMPPPNWEHEFIAVNILGAIFIWLKDHPIGRVTGQGGSYILEHTPPSILIPDVGFIADSRRPRGAAVKGPADGSPDLAVEVLSPFDRMTGVSAKVHRYLEAGTKLVWFVDPDDRSVTVYSTSRPSVANILRETDTLDGEDVLPGFNLPLQEVFSNED